MLNGRHGVCNKNDFTSISSKCLAIVDYSLVPFEKLQNFYDFQVHRSIQRIQECGCVPYIDPTKKVPDHSILTWKIMCESLSGSVYGHTKDNDPLQDTYTTYSRDYPNDFMQNESCVQAVNEAIEHLEGAENYQQEVDVVYDGFCSTVKREYG